MSNPNIAPTIVLRNKNPLIKTTTTVAGESKFNAAKNVQGGSSVSNAKKIEAAAEDGKMNSVTIPREISQLIQTKRTELGKTRKELAPTIKSINVKDLDEMETGKMILNQANRTKIQAVGRALGLGPLDLPKFTS